MTPAEIEDRRVRRIKLLARLRRRRIIARHLHRTRLWRQL